jgi:hypothetical protein
MLPVCGAEEIFAARFSLFLLSHLTELSCLTVKSAHSYNLPYNRFTLLSREFSVSIQFSRSLRSLHIDSYRSAQIGLVIASVVLLALIIWFFSATVTLYQSASEVAISEDGKILAQFSPESINRVHLGQRAILRLSQGADQPVLTLPAYVFDKTNDQVEIILLEDQLPAGWEGEAGSSQLQVAVDHLTPAALVLRALGRTMNQPNLPVNSQTSKESPP